MGVAGLGEAQRPGGGFAGVVDPHPGAAGDGFRGHRPAGDDYHVTEDIVDQAIDWMDAVQSLDADKPFFLYLAPGAVHAPLQVAQSWIDQYDGQNPMKITARTTMTHQ